MPITKIIKINRGSYYEFYVPQGEIGQKADNGRLEVFWQKAEDTDYLHLVCPCCYGIQNVPLWLVDRRGWISCMHCAYCRADHSYILLGWEETIHERKVS